MDIIGENISFESFSPDDKKIVVGGSEMKVDPLRNFYSSRILDIATGKSLLLYENDPHGGRESFSPNSKYLLSASLDGLLRVWDANTGATFYSGQIPNGILSASFSPNSKFILITRSDGMVRLVDLSSKESLLLFNRPDGLVSASFSPDGKYVLTLGQDGTGRIYECEVCGLQAELLALSNSRILAYADADKNSVSEADRLKLLFDPANPVRSRAMIKARVDQIVVENIDSYALDRLDQKIKPEHTLIKDFELDSDGQSKLFEKFSTEFGIPFPEVRTNNLKTVGDVYIYIESQLQYRWKVQNRRKRFQRN